MCTPYPGHTPSYIAILALGRQGIRIPTNPNFLAAPPCGEQLHHWSLEGTASLTQTGVYVGNDPSALTSYTAWVGHAPGNVLNYLNNDSWSAFDSSIGYEVNLWKSTPASSIWSVPLTVSGTSLEQVATGAYDSHFLMAAQDLAQTKPSADGNIYIRVGWEFNGSWMPWAAQGHEDAFVKAFQEVVTTFRSVSDKFKFVWDVNEGDSTYNPAKAYPGDKYVDVVGMDSYYNTAYDSTDPAKAFQHNVNEIYGLQWQQDFAAAHGKATAISEWGVATDNAAPYIQAMAKWMTSHSMVYENYWNSNAGGYSGQLSTGQNPDAGLAYREAIADLQSGAASTTATATTAAAAAATVAPTVSTASNSDTLVLKVSVDSWHGDPHFMVTVDGKQVGGTLTAAASHAAGQTQDITLTGSFGPGAHDVAVQFLDDAYGGTAATDRNLYVHQISLDGQVAAGNAAANHAGFNNNGVANLYSNGSAKYQLPPPVDDTVVFRVSADSYKGDPRFIIFIDGTQVGGVQTTSAAHAAGQTEDITLHTQLSTGSHDVALKFINDVYDGTASTDRNLYVHQISVDGHVYGGDLAKNHAGSNVTGVAALYSNGSIDWHL